MGNIIISCICIVEKKHMVKIMKKKRFEEEGDEVLPAKTRPSQ